MKEEDILVLSVSELRENLDLERQIWYQDISVLDKLEQQFKSRSVMEKDFDYKQLIPYAVFKNRDGKVLSYSRCGSESRLSGLRSVGIGGHVNVDDKGATIPETLVNGLLREIKEEVGVSVSKDSVRFTGFINEEETEAGRCHIGVVFVVEVDESALVFDSEISDPKWIKTEEVSLGRFELWSEMALRLLDRKRIHIALVGKQPAPVYNGIAYADPDKVVLLYSDETVDNAKRIAESIQISSERRKLDPVDFDNIEKKMQEMVSKYKYDDVTINISSGTKNWAYYFSRFPYATIFFVDQNCVVWDFTNKSKIQLEFNSEIQFKLYGTVPSDYTKFTDYSDEDRQVLKDIISLQNFGGNVFMRLVGMMNDHTNETYQMIDTGQNAGSFISWDKTERSMSIQINKGSKSMSKDLKSPHVRDFVLKAGWFEYKVADILSRWRHAKEIWLNPKFKYESGAPKNEIDIIVNTGVKYLFVEVKTQIEDNTDIDKFSRAVENFSGSGSKKLFVTQVAMRDKAVEKCNDNGVISFSLESPHLGMDTEQSLFMLLDNALFTIEA